MTWRNRDIWDVSVGASDIGMATLFLMRRAARWRGVSWEYFSRLPTQQQAGYIAEYLTEMRIQAIEALAAQARQKRTLAQAKQKRRSRPRIRR